VSVSAGGLNKLAKGPAKKAINALIPPEQFDRFAKAFMFSA
jgi:hypothetical protein